MTTKQLAAIEAHGAVLRAIFPRVRNTDTVKLCKQLRRLETRAHKLAEDYCNGLIDEAAWTVESNHIRNKLNDVLGYVSENVPVFINGDPRGYALKIDEEWVSKAETVLRDSVPEYIGPDACGYMHRTHAYSIAHATRHEGYTLYSHALMTRDMGGYGILAPCIDKNGN